MIDITVDKEKHVVEVEGKTYAYTEMSLLLEEVLDSAFYKGESISLWWADGDVKIAIKYYP